MIKSIPLYLFVLGIFIAIASIQTSISGLAISQALFLPLSIIGIISYKKLDLKIPKSLIFLILFFLAASISVTLNWNELTNPVKSLSKLRYFLIGAISYFGFYIFFQSYPQKAMRYIFYWFHLCILGVAVYSFYIIDISSKSRLSGFFNPMVIGYGSALYASLVFGWLIFSPYPGKNLVVSFLKRSALFSLYMIFMIIANARGAIIGFTASVLCVLPFIRRQIAAYSLGVLAITGLAMYLANSTGIYKVRVFGSYDTKSSHVRISQYKAAWELFKEKPIWGHGILAFHDKARKIKKKFRIEHAKFKGHAHSQTFQLLSENGIIGFILYHLWFLFWAFECFKSEEGKKYLPFIFTALISFQFETLITDNLNNFFIIMMYAYSMAQIQREKVLTANLK